MRTRAALILSFVLNVVLVVVLYGIHSERAEISSSNPIRPQPTSSVPVVKTNVVVRRLNFTWSQIETNDYRAYISNLREIGCPEATIRDIVLADVNALYEQRKLTEVVTPEQQWWRSNSDPAVAQTAMQESHALELERRALLNELLGANWEESSNWEAAAFNARFDGPILGALGEETKEALRNAEMRASQRRVEYLTARQESGEPVDPFELGRLKREMRSDLAKILSSEQLEEYLLRYSEVAQNLRGELRGFEVSPDEFRKIFRARDQLQRQTSVDLAGSDVVSLQHQEQQAKALEASLRDAFGEERYRLYQYNQDPMFRDAQDSAREIGMAAELVLPIYEINQASELERQRIQSESGLTAEERAAALALALERQEESLRQVLGDRTYGLYRERSAPAAAPTGN